MKENLLSLLTYYYLSNCIHGDKISLTRTTTLQIPWLYVHRWLEHRADCSRCNALYWCLTQGHYCRHSLLVTHRLPSLHILIPGKWMRSERGHQVCTVATLPPCIYIHFMDLLRHMSLFWDGNVTYSVSFLFVLIWNYIFTIQICKVDGCTSLKKWHPVIRDTCMYQENVLLYI